MFCMGNDDQQHRVNKELSMHSAPLTEHKINAMYLLPMAKNSKADTYFSIGKSSVAFILCPIKGRHLAVWLGT